ncbi:Lreu_0056 family protein [Limosilactobacillus caecicola]|uniref:Lreu_0056 family protein n=1 Tax=Limosilactobacillus caecicola TaxID=2941332 RepID=UPI00203C296F|nr:DUF4767 domain-containing protein [Limosilactobacillus caecicola]
MKLNRLSVLGVLAAGAILLSGCGQSSATNHSTQSSSATSGQSTTKSATSTNKKSSQLWNSTKDQELTDFMNKWAPTMGQSYTKYDGKNDLTTKAGMKYPSDLSQTTVNGSNSSIGWAPTGKGSYDYNVVALYNYDRPGNAATHITYAFAFHNNQPVALVEQSTNGTPNWTQTQNADVESNFEKIANGSDSSTTSSSSSKSSTKSTKSGTVSDQTIGIMVGLLKDPDWMKKWLSSGEMYYGTEEPGSDKDVGGYSYITANGDPESYIFYTSDGTNVTIKQWTSDAGESVAEGHYETSTISLKQLKTDYYNNSSKKSEVNGYVSELRPISEANH